MKINRICLFGIIELRRFAALARSIGFLWLVRFKTLYGHLAIYTSESLAIMTTNKIPAHNFIVNHPHQYPHIPNRRI